MKEILIAIVTPNLLLILVLLAVRASKNKGGGYVSETFENVPVYDSRVFEILRLAHLDLIRQRGAGYGPWISSALENHCGDAAVALMAIRWTVRDILSAPKSYDKDGKEIQRVTVNLDGLRKAEVELEEIMGERD